MESLREFAKETKESLVKIEKENLISLAPYIDEENDFNNPPDEWREKYNLSLDGFSGFPFPEPSEEEKTKIIEKFLNGIEKLLNPESNWTFLKPFSLSLKYCVKCNTCAEACHVYIGSGKKEIYRPNFRSEILRRIYKRYFTPSGKLLKSFVGADIEATYTAIRRLLELAYRCTLCRRCVLYCPVGIDNGLIARELRKLFSQELGMAPVEVYKKGTRLHLKTGSSTGMGPTAFRDIIKFIEEEIHEKIGKKITIPVDKKGADILLLHNGGEYLAWPDHIAAFSILFDLAGINYTLSSETLGYDGVNYGAWYDDVELARVGLRHLQIAYDLGVKKLVIGECGHSHKVYTIIFDRILPASSPLWNIQRESCLPLMWEIVKSGRIKFDPMRNNFPVTMHDSCNIVRLMGIMNPQRQIIKALTPGTFREMNPNCSYNYCCGGGSGFAIIRSLNFPVWKNKVSIRLKTKQILDTFDDVLDKNVPKLVVATCSNCKGAIRDMIHTYRLFDRFKINYSGLAELIVNAIATIPPFLNLEELPE
ncbi:MULTISPECIES: (Fe-S)-binding protein [Thermodesulfovibrio]|uniref:(Fe-S)-binding protein n=1 Tax=Thermodesulfovibrio TaxID=28261 RepID=UPI0003F54315|nr:MULTISPECIES: (Fe-S)-binding protein [Thermodesulfovibrio]MDI6865584.1 (Fe-S)-binding protein [Thermodesulfovibrio yellowstonii]